MLKPHSPKMQPADFIEFPIQLNQCQNSRGGRNHRQFPAGIPEGDGEISVMDSRDDGPWRWRPSPLQTDRAPSKSRFSSRAQASSFRDSEVRWRKWARSAWRSIRPASPARAATRAWRRRRWASRSTARKGTRSRRQRRHSSLPSTEALQTGQWIMISFPVARDPTAFRRRHSR